MNVLIIEDEPVARQMLAHLLVQHFPDIAICGQLDGVDQSVAWLESHPAPDAIFMDIQLGDGQAFDLFERTTIDCPVVMTTAYDHYAVKAFEVNSIDYLLKPIGLPDLQRAVDRCRSRRRQTGFDLSQLRELREALAARPEPHYKQRYLLRFNDKLVMVETSQIAYFYSEQGSTYLMTVAGEKYLMDTSLDTICEEMDPARFFRISRSCIISGAGIGSVAKRLGNRLKLKLKPESDIDSFVSRAKTAEFIAWLENGGK